MKSLGVDNVQDYFSKRADVALYLCSEWIRFLAEVPDRSHTTRVKIHELWECVNDAFRAWTGESNKDVKRVRVGAIETGGLLRQAIGVMLSVETHEAQGEILEPGEFLERILNRFKAALPRIDVTEEMIRRYVAWGCMGDVT